MLKKKLFRFLQSDYVTVINKKSNVLCIVSSKMYISLLEKSHID